ncbi:MAG: GNAT family N-acetyltransferase [Chitinophagaceae bacterium]
MSSELGLISGRLQLRPLSLTQLETYMKANDKLEKEMGLTAAGRTISPDVKDMVEFYSFPKMKLASSEAQLFLTFWIVIDVTINQIVCELGFKGTPDQNSEIEIGYGTFPHQQGKGYMTEAVGIISKWALSRVDVRGVLAETDAKNAASIRVVQKNGFLQFAERDKMLWWRKTRSGVPRTT